jgi:hypothetical protein
LYQQLKFNSSPGFKTWLVLEPETSDWRFSQQGMQNRDIRLTAEAQKRLSAQGGDGERLSPILAGDTMAASQTILSGSSIIAIPSV